MANEPVPITSNLCGIETKAWNYLHALVNEPATGFIYRATSEYSIVKNDLIVLLNTVVRLDKDLDSAQRRAPLSREDAGVPQTEEGRECLVVYGGPIFYAIYRRGNLMTSDLCGSFADFMRHLLTKVGFVIDYRTIEVGLLPLSTDGNGRVVVDVHPANDRIVYGTQGKCQDVAQFRNHTL